MIKIQYLIKVLLLLFCCLLLGNVFAVSIKESAKKASDSQIEKLISALTPAKRSALEDRLLKEKAVLENPFGITFYMPTYILPYYYTFSPYHKIYEGNTPRNQKIKPAEFKGQFSFKFPIWHKFLGGNGSFNIGYTQLMYWQVYASSQYFRETNYEPEIFFSKPVMNNLLLNVGVVHESNGRGGDLERSWNRAYADLMFSWEHWVISLKPWILIFKRDSSDLHNKDIADYLGHGRFVFAYKWKGNIFSLMLRNNIESGFHRGAAEFDYNFHIHGHINGYLQVFRGYGQSLLEYNHLTTGAGIGIALSHWI